MKTISAHVLFKNEEKWLWYSACSVIDHVDKLLLWDTGSTDRSWEIAILIKEKYPNKVILNRVLGDFDEAKVRQEMLDATDTDWFIVVDGDEIWWEDSIKKLTNLIQKNGDKLESIITPMVVLVGDIFHFQENSAGRYKFGNKLGHYALRAINKKIDGLSSNKPHGQWGWTDGEGKMIQNRDSNKIGFVDSPYLHLTHLQRSFTRSKDLEVVKRKNKLKHEIGIQFPKDFYYPEAFFKEKPNFIESPWSVMFLSYKLRAFFETPLRKIKRRFKNEKVGY